MIIDWGITMDLGPGELFIILVIVIAVFGTGKLAGAGRALGTSIREFRHAVQEEPPRTGQLDEQREHRQV